jgi:hypothetical protein
MEYEVLKGVTMESSTFEDITLYSQQTFRRNVTPVSMVGAMAKDRQTQLAVA